MLSKFFDRPIALKFSSHEIIGKRGGLNLELVRAILALVFRKRIPLIFFLHSSDKLTLKKDEQIFVSLNYVELEFSSESATF